MNTNSEKLRRHFAYLNKEDRDTLLNWIDKNLFRSEKPCRGINSDDLWEAFSWEHGWRIPGLCFTGALLLTGHWPVDFSADEWEFYIDEDSPAVRWIRNSRENVRQIHKEDGTINVLKRRY